MRREAGRFFPRADPGKLVVKGSWSFIYFLICLVVRDCLLGFSCARLFPAAHLPWPVCWLSFVGEEEGGGVFGPALCRLAAEVNPDHRLGDESSG